MISLSLGQVADVTGGELVGEACPDITSGVFTDSRLCVPGSLYVARVGEHADGHRYVPAARAAGAVACLTSQDVEDTPYVRVPDVELAFGKVARAVVDAAPRLDIVGITGSSGKTSTKDLLGQVLAEAGETVAPEGSYNSEVGVPLTVCRITESTRYLVAEMGATHVGNIAYLTRIAPPRIGIVLNVGVAHVGEFGGVENIARTKGELVEALAPDGVAVLNADDPVVAGMAARTRARVLLVGRAPEADVRAEDVTLDDLGRPSFTATTPWGETRVTLRLHGEHQVGNALAVLAAACELGMPLDAAAAALGRARPVSRWRMEVGRMPSGAVIVNDAYNANPDSMRAGLRALAAMSGGRTTWAVLGEMRELGEDSEPLHERVGRDAVELGIDRVVAVGAGAAGVLSGARAAGADEARLTQLADTAEAEKYLREHLGEADVALLKSSRDSGLRLLGDALTGADAAGSGDAPVARYVCR